MTVTSAAKTRDYARELDLCLQRLAEDPHDLDALLVKGRCLIELDRCDEALGVAETVRQSDPENAASKHMIDFCQAQADLAAEMAECERLGQPTPAPDPYLCLAKAWYLEELDESDEAIACYDRALEIDPDDASTWFFKGLLLENTRKFEAALDCFDRSLKINPQERVRWWQKAHLLRSLGSLDQGLACCDDALAVAPDHVDIFYEKALMLRRLGRGADALACYDQALARDPNAVLALEGRALCLWEMDREDEALAHLDRLLTIEPDMVSAREIRNRILAANDPAYGDPGNAASAIRGGPAEASRSSVREELMGLLEPGAGPPRARDRFAELETVELAPPVPEASAPAGPRDTRDILRHLDKALALDPDDAGSWCEKGDILADRRRYKEALSCYERATTAEPAYGYAWYARGFLIKEHPKACGYAKGDAQTEALRCAKRATKAEPTLKGAWFLMAECLGAHQPDEAIACYERILAVDPNDRHAHMLKALALFDLRRHSQALAAIDKVLALAPDDAYAWFNKGKIVDAAQECAEDSKEAISCWDKAIALNPNMVAAWLAKGTCLRRAGDFRAAAECAEAGLRIEPENQLLGQLKRACLAAVAGDA